MWKKALILFVPLALLGSMSLTEEWMQEIHKGYKLYYQGDDESEKKRYVQYMDDGIRSVKFFSKDNFSKEFDVYVHPDRKALDTQWQNDWKMPDLRSECWMVASGIAGKLDLLSPLKWKTEACEHDYGNKDKTKKLITHELFHIYHAQKNPSPDFAETQGLDWFVEGFATFASGQCDTERLAEIKKAIENKTAPSQLDDFWKGKLKYGLSGSIVMHIDSKYGREKLKELLKYKTKTEVLGALKTTEKELLEAWADYIKKMK